MNRPLMRGKNFTLSEMVEKLPEGCYIASVESTFCLPGVDEPFLARYYLRALEKRAAGESDPELIPNPNEEDVNLEHVLPLKPEKNWPQFDDESVKAFHRRLGNMVLIRQKLNSSLKSAPFSKKKVVLASSKFSLQRKSARWANGMRARLKPVKGSLQS